MGQSKPGLWWPWWHLWQYQPSQQQGARALACAADTTVRFWDLATWRCVRKCDGHEDAVRVLAASDGKVFSGAYDGAIGVW